MKHVLAALAVCSITLTAAWSARAETIFLTCPRFDPLTIDLTNNTVNNFPATINATAIDWESPSRPTAPAGTTVVVRFHIDRTTGILSQYEIFHLPTGQQQGNSYTNGICAVGGHPTTKF